MGQIASCLCHKSRGVLYAGTQESFKWLGWSLLGIIAYVAWAGLATTLLMLPLHLSGRLKYMDENGMSTLYVMNRIRCIRDAIVILLVALVYNWDTMSNVKCFSCFPVYERGIDACIHKEPAYPDIKILYNGVS